MSLSDKKEKSGNTNAAGDDAWEPLDIASLHRFGSETYLRTDRTKPDYSLFKVLVEEPLLNESDLFKRWHEIDSGANRGNKAAEVHDIIGSDKRLDSEMDSGALSESDKARDSGYEAGYDQGFEAGNSDGYLKGEKEGYAAGFLKGESEAMEKGAEKAEKTLAAMADILSSMEGAWAGLVKRYEAEILSLICRIAERVVWATVDLDESIVRESVVKALETLPEPEEITLNIAPEDYDYIEMVKEDFFERIDTLTAVSVISNASVNRGGCTIETSKAKVKTDIESRLSAVFSAITDAGPS